MPFTLRIIALEDDADICMCLRKLSGYSGSSIDQNKNREIMPFNYEGGNQEIVPYSYGGERRGSNQGFPSNKYEYGGQAGSPNYYGMGGNMGVAPYISNNYYNGISPSQQCASQALQPYHHGGVRKGVSPYYQGGKPGISEMGMRPKQDTPKAATLITKVKCKRKCCAKTTKPDQGFGISAMSARSLGPGLGSLARKYLPIAKKEDFVFGLHYDKKLKGYRVGYHLAHIEGNDIAVDYEDEVIRYKGTEGLWRLITQDTSYFDEEFYFDDEDWVVFMEMLLRTNYHKCCDTVVEDGKNKVISKFSVADEDVEIAPMFLCCLGLGALGAAGGVIAGGAAGLVVGTAGGLAVGGTAGVAAGGAVLGTIGFISGVAVTIPTILGLKLAAPLAVTFGKALQEIMATRGKYVGKAVGSVAQAGVRLYGKIGDMNRNLYDVLKDNFSNVVETIIPGKPRWLRNPMKNYLKFWNWFQCPTCVYWRELDELIRLLISFQKPGSKRNKLCGFSQNCILFWILERIFASFGYYGGCERIVDWLKVNMKLINKSELLKQFLHNLPWGYHCKHNPICAPPKREGEKDKACKDQIKKYTWFLELDVPLRDQVILGIDVFEELITRDKAFFEKLEGSINVSCKMLSDALKKGLEFMKSYFNGCKK